MSAAGPSPEMSRAALLPRGTRSPYCTLVNAYKRELILAELRAHKFNVTKAAGALGLQRTYLHRLIRVLDIDKLVVIARDGR